MGNTQRVIPQARPESPPLTAAQNNPFQGLPARELHDSALPVTALAATAADARGQSLSCLGRLALHPDMDTHHLRHLPPRSGRHRRSHAARQGPVPVEVGLGHPHRLHGGRGCGGSVRRQRRGSDVSVPTVSVGYLVRLLTRQSRVGAVYTSGSFRMSTWIPFIWGWVNVLVQTISSFSIQGGL